MVWLTAGYGYSTPKTAGGKIFCMLYALTGIPLNLVMFQSIGERLNIFVTFTLKHLKRCFRFKSREVSYIHRRRRDKTIEGFVHFVRRPN